MSESQNGRRDVAFLVLVSGSGQQGGTAGFEIQVLAYETGKEAEVFALLYCLSES